MEENYKEMQLLSISTPNTSASSSHPQPRLSDSTSTRLFRGSIDHFDSPSLDLKLSISVTPLKPPISDCVLRRKFKECNELNIDSSCIEALKWQAAEQIRLATMEKAYAERVRELTRREMEQAQSEFTRARNMWERAREEVERAEKMKERASREADWTTCMEITCQSCRQKFRP